MVLGVLVGAQCYIMPALVFPTPRTEGAKLGLWLPGLWVFSSSQRTWGNYR